MGDSSQTVLWDSRRVRSFICGTYDQSSILSKLHLNGHILQLILGGEGGHTILSPRRLLTEHLSAPSAERATNRPPVERVQHLCEERDVGGKELYRILIDELVAAAGGGFQAVIPCLPISMMLRGKQRRMLCSSVEESTSCV